jgi:hypothetical protein
MSASRSARLVRRWVALYTLGLPAELRDARRAEIEDDLWSQAHEVEDEDASADGASGDVLARLVFGLWSDTTWRLEQRHRDRVRPVLRSPTMGTRVIAALAIIGGAASAVTLAITMALVSSAPDGTSNTLDWSAPEVTVTLSVYLGAIVMLSFALWGLVLRFNDRMHGSVAMAGSVGGLGAVLGPVMGAYALVVLLPMGSAAVVWDLSRSGAMSRIVAIVHTLAAVAFLVVYVAAATGSLRVTSPIDAMAVLIVLYPLTWILIGLALLRGQPVADQPQVVGSPS